MEREYLKPLPAARYELKDYCRAKVQKIGYVYFSPDKSYYSVPYRYISMHTTIQYTKGMVEVYYNHRRIALHSRNPSKGSYNTNREHLSSTHKHYSDRSPGFFKDKVLVHRNNVARCVEQIIARVDYPEIGYKRAMGVIQLHRAYTFSKEYRCARTHSAPLRKLSRSFACDAVHRYAP